MKISQRLKTELYNYCKTIVDVKIKRLRASLSEIQISANNETKSSAGDKYETGRAMMQLEKEKFLTQLNEQALLKKVLDELNVKATSTNVVLGSLVETTMGVIYLSVSLGQVKLNGELFFVVSPVSPIGQKMKQLKPGDVFQMNGNKVTIKGVL